jgi:ubiquinone/menaquinone biosynthesis C-methylase UbiE
MTTKNYSLITETPGQKADKEQLERALQRYRFAKEFTKNKKVLEVACGSGIGLNYIAETAQNCTGIDIDDNNLLKAKEITKNSKYQHKIIIKKSDAHQLPFNDNEFEVIIFFEAIYYLQNPEKFIKEAYRVLQTNGLLIIGSVNKDWENFHPSPFTYRYFSIPNYQELLNKYFNKINYFGGFYTASDSAIFSLIKKTAAKMHLIPRSLKARAYLKRIFMGKLSKLPENINDNMATYYKPEPIKEIKTNSNYKIIYITAQK